MPASSTFQGPTFSDILTRGIPGLVVVVPVIFVVIFVTNISFTTLTSAQALGLILIGSLVCGEVFHNIRNTLKNPPRHFVKIIYDGDNVHHLTVRDQIRTSKGRENYNFLYSIFGRATEELFGKPEHVEAPVFSENDVGFLETLTNHMAVNPDSTSSYQIYYMAIRHLESDFSAETHRRRRLYTMSANVTIGYYFSMLASTLILLLNIVFQIIPGTNVPRVWLLYAVSVFVLIVPMYYATRFYLMETDANFVEACIIEYYYDRFAAERGTETH